MGNHNRHFERKRDLAKQISKSKNKMCLNKSLFKQRINQSHQIGEGLKKVRKNNSEWKGFMEH